MKSEIEIITTRLEKVEKQNRFLQHLLLFLIGIFSVGSFMGWTQYSVPKVVEAERFILKDSTGRVKSAWYSDVFKNDDTSYHQSRLEFYEKADTSIMIGFKKEYNKPLMHLQTTAAIFDSTNPITWKMKLYPTRLSLGSGNMQDSLSGHGISLENVWQPDFSMSNSDEHFQMTLLDTGMNIDRFGINPNIVFNSNGTEDGECINCKKHK